MKHTIKYQRAVVLYRGFKGPATVRAIFGAIPESCWEKLTAAEIAELAEVLHAQHEAGKRQAEEETK